MNNLKLITDHKDAVANLFADVGKNNVVCYDVEEFPASGFSSFYPKPYLDKCSCVTVATSGDAHNHDWMVVLPFRIDESGRAGPKVYDIDPFVVTFDSDTGSPAATGIVAYHQSFESRTSPISGYDHLTKPQTVTALRQQLTTGYYPISDAVPPVAEALHHMADLFRKTLK
jgi:hypothetical protein